jgi:hypothetical protein
MSLGPLDGPSEVGALRAPGSQESRWVLSAGLVRSVYLGHADLRKSTVGGGPSALARTAVGGSPSVPGVGGAAATQPSSVASSRCWTNPWASAISDFLLSPKWGVWILSANYSHRDTHARRGSLSDEGRVQVDTARTT